MKKIKERIFGNWKTSALGLLVLGVGFVFVWFGKITMPEFTAFVTGALALLLSKDENHPNTI